MNRVTTIVAIVVWGLLTTTAFAAETTEDIRVKCIAEAQKAGGKELQQQSRLIEECIKANTPVDEGGKKND